MCVKLTHNWEGVVGRILIHMFIFQKVLTDYNGIIISPTELLFVSIKNHKLQISYPLFL